VDRRRFLLTSLARALAAPVAVEAQQDGKVYRIGFLRFGPAAASADRVEALRTGLRELGYVEGKNIVIEFRWADTVDQLSQLAAELVRMKVDVIFAPSSTEVGPVRQVTKTIPIVFATHADPVGVGHVVSLARPGGNTTGLSMILTDLVPKELEVMKQALPHMKRIGVLLSLTAPSHRPAADALAAAAPKLGVALHMVPVQTVDDFDRAFTTMAREHVSGVFVIGSAFTFAHRTRLAELALKHRLPTMFAPKENVEAGGLMSYAPDLVDLTRRAATYIDKILKGAKPGDLPVEQASKYELVINLKTAKALGLTIPPSLLARADQVIE
jgi:putative ABC transport system substrate-binding protein